MIQALLKMIFLTCVFLFIFTCSFCNIVCIIYFYVKIRTRLRDIFYDDSEKDNE
jgi:hypothetical protein